MYKLIYLGALLLLCLNFVSCGKPTTLVVTKTRCYDSKKDRFSYTIAAKLDIQNEVSQKIDEVKSNKQGQEKKYLNYYSKDRKFSMYTSFANQDLTYVSNGRSQYLDNPVKLENCNANKCFCNATTYYGWI